MPNATLDECYTGPRDPEGPTAVDSHLYNSMIHPFVHAKQAVSSVVWYQVRVNAHLVDRCPIIICRRILSSAVFHILVRES
eukprot:COSAG02_NODE_130_length_34758_cov_80.817767_23_plen_81_part_00